LGKPEPVERKINVLYVGDAGRHHTQVRRALFGNPEVVRACKFTKIKEGDIERHLNAHPADVILTSFDFKNSKHFLAFNQLNQRLQNSKTILIDMGGKPEEKEYGAIAKAIALHLKGVNVRQKFDRHTETQLNGRIRAIASGLKKRKAA
jgi:hypothetical protein